MGTPRVSSLVHVPCRSGSPHGVFPVLAAGVWATSGIAAAKTIKPLSAKIRLLIRDLLKFNCKPLPGDPEKAPVAKTTSGTTTSLAGLLAEIAVDQLFRE